MPNHGLTTYKKYKSYPTKGKHGILCRVNNTQGSYPLHRHDYIEIEYLVSGKLDHDLNGAKSIFSTGDCWCLDNRDLHMFTVLEPVEIHNICIDLKTVPDTIKDFLATITFPMVGHLSNELMPIVNNLFKNLFYVTSNNCSYSEEKAIANLLLLLTHMFENCRTTSFKPSSSSYEHIAKAIEYIMQNYAQPITLTEVAQAIHLSPNHLSKLFPEVSGITFLDYLTNHRIKKAKELLASTDIPVTYIAYDCGFGSFSSFSRIFKKQNGCTPTAFRERTRNP